MSITPEQRAELRKLAEAATGGEWRWRSKKSNWGDEYYRLESTLKEPNQFDLRGYLNPTIFDADCENCGTVEIGFYEDADAQFIAASNPGQVIALLDALDAAEGVASDYDEEIAALVRERELATSHAAQKDESRRMAVEMMNEAKDAKAETDEENATLRDAAIKDRVTIEAQAAEIDTLKKENEQLNEGLTAAYMSGSYDAKNKLEAEIEALKAKLAKAEDAFKSIQDRYHEATNEGAPNTRGEYQSALIDIEITARDTLKEIQDDS